MRADAPTRPASYRGKTSSITLALGASNQSELASFVAVRGCASRRPDGRANAKQKLTATQRSLAPTGGVVLALLKLRPATSKTLILSDYA
jgi:hypothetical protein